MNATVVNSIPYGPDIKLLQETWPVARLQLGFTIHYDEFSQVLGYDRHSSRFYSVIRSWCHLEDREHGIFMAWEPKIGLRVLGQSGKLMGAELKTARGCRAIRRGKRMIDSVDTEQLDDLGKKRLDHDRHVLAVLYDHISSAQKQLASELAPIKSLPRPSIPSTEH